MTRVYRTNLMLMENKNRRMIYEYNINLDDKPIVFVHDPLRNTFADTAYAYEENIPEDVSSHLNSNIYTYIRLVQPERVFSTFREFLIFQSVSPERVKNLESLFERAKNAEMYYDSENNHTMFTYL